MRSSAAMKIVPPETMSLMTLMTLEEWADMDEPGELVDGRLEEEEVTTSLHDLIVTWLVATLHRWGRPHHMAVFGSEHKIRIDETRGRKPDVSMYAAGVRFRPEGLSKKPPLLAVEVLSRRRRDIRRDRIDKLQDYARRGIKLYMIIIPEPRILELFELNAEGKYVAVQSASLGKMTLPGCEGLELDLDALWSEVTDFVGEKYDEDEGRDEGNETAEAPQVPEEGDQLDQKEESPAE